MTRRALTVAVAGLLLAPAGASAHAVVERTSPAQGTVVEAPPELVAFYFSEPVEASFGAVRVFDAQGEQVEAGDLVRPDDRSDAVGAELPSELGDGTYTATFRVVSADSHPVSGGFVFSIGAPGADPEQTVSELLDESEAGPVTDVAFAADRFVGYAAIGVALGAIVFLLVAFAPAATSPTVPVGAEAAFGRAFRRLLWLAIGVGLVATLMAIPLQGANAGGIGFFEALDPDRLADVAETRFGEAMLIRAGAWIALAVVLAAAWRPSAIGPPAWALYPVGAALGLLAVTPALSGHARTQDPVAVLFPADVVHVVAMGVWLGGLVTLLAAVPAATRAIEPGERTPLLGAVLRRFSALALGAVVALAVTGTIQAVIEVGSFADMVETGFGRMVTAKILLFAALVGLGWANRGRLLPALDRLAEAGSEPGRVGLAVRRNLRLEAGLIAVVLAVTAVLVSYAPPSDSVAGPASGRTEVGGNILEYTVDPARVGANQLHLYLFDAADGSQFDGAKEVTVRAVHEEKRIGPLDVEVRRAGPGHFVAPAAPFGVPGDWTVTVEVRTSRFDQQQAEFEVPIR